MGCIRWCGDVGLGGVCIVYEILIPGGVWVDRHYMMSKMDGSRTGGCVKRKDLSSY